jgi:Na+-driven multidrug efflux pump
MNKEILRLAIPNILSNLSVPLLSSFDTALMGRLTELHIGAVGIGAMIFNFNLLELWFPSDGNNRHYSTSIWPGRS